MFSVRGELLQRVHLRLVEISPASQLQPRIADRTDRDALELIDWVADRVEHVANLPVPSFVDGDVDGRVTIAATRQQAYDACGHALSLDGDAAREPVEIVRVRNAQHPRLVNPGNAVPRVRQSRGEVAVIGQDQEPFGIKVQTADRIDILANSYQQIDNGRTSLWIRTRCHISPWLVQEEITMPLGHGD